MEQKPSTIISEKTRKILLENKGLNEMQAGLKAVGEFLDEIDEGKYAKE